MIYTISTSTKYENGNRSYAQNTVEVIECGKNRYEKDFFIRSGLNEYHSLYWICSGSVLLKDEHVQLAKNTLIFVPKLYKISFSAMEDTTLLRLSFDYSGALPFSKSKKHILNATHEIQESLDRLYRVGLFNDALPGTAESYLLIVLNEMRSLINADYSYRKLFEDTHEWIAQNAKQDISASDVAAAMNRSIGHLNRIIRAHTDGSLSTLIAEQRISAIKQLCSYKGISAETIAKKLDFASPELLRKYFKYHTGIPLKQYLKENS